MKKLPNTLSALRLFFGGALFWLPLFSPLFFACYLFCGVSDVLDGYFARRLHCATTLGAALDSAADFVFIVAFCYRILPLLSWRPWMLCCLALILSLRLLTLGSGFVKYRKFAFLHTYANKATGFGIFCFPLLWLWVGSGVTFLSLSALALLSAAEELYLTLTAETLNRDTKGIFFL